MEYLNENTKLWQNYNMFRTSGACKISRVSSIRDSRALSTKQKRLFPLTFWFDPRCGPTIRASSGEKVKTLGISSSASKGDTTQSRRGEYLNLPVRIRATR